MLNVIKKVCVIAGALTLALIGTAQADLVGVGDIIKFTDSHYGSTNGGEFIATDTSKSNLMFNTFCIETNEYLNFTSGFKVAGISTAAILGGAGGATDGSDPLDQRTAYLFQNFADNTLQSYNYADTPNGSSVFGSRSASADALQNAIWFFEGEISSTNSSYVALAEGAVANGWRGIGNVRVLNLVYASDGSRAQDVLTVNAVPIPAAVLLLGTGLAGLLGTRIRRKK